MASQRRLSPSGLLLICARCRLRTEARYTGAGKLAGGSMGRNGGIGIIGVIVIVLIVLFVLGKL
jgi:hypothetical protein